MRTDHEQPIPIAADQAFNAAPAAASRLQSLDSFKGVLVVLMVVYHATFVADRIEPTSFARFVTASLYFLHVAFLFAAGFVVGFYYRSKLASNNLSVRRRLFQRGIKLYILFLGSNCVLISLGLGPPMSDITSLIETPPSLLHSLLLDIRGSMFAFEILAYIACFLVVCSVAIGPATAMLAIVFWIAFALCELPLFRMLAVGSVGALVGELRFRVGPLTWVPHKYDRFSWLLIVVSRPLALELYGGQSATGREMMVVFDTLLCWWASAALARRFPDRFGAVVNRLGEATLFAYLFHLAVVRILAVCFPLAGIQSALFAYMTTVASVLPVTYVAVRSVQRAKGSSPKFRSVYRLVFE